MTSKLLPILIFTSLVCSSHASHEAVLRFDEVRLRSDLGVEIEMTNLRTGPVVRIMVGKKAFPIDKRYLPEVTDIETNSIQLRVHMGGPNQPAPERLLDFSVYFAFGGTYSHGEEEEGKEVIVTKMLRLVFEGGQFTHSIVCIPEGNYKNRWRYVEIYPNAIEPDGKVNLEEEFFHHSVKSPYDAP